MRIDRKTRKACKSAAVTSLRKHYVTLVLMCLFASFIGAEFVISDNFIAARTDVMDLLVQDYQEEIIENEKEAEALTGASVFTEKIEDLTNSIRLADEDYNAIFSRSAGTINQILNAFTSGTLVSTVSSVVLNIVGSQSAADIIMICLSTVVAVWFWMFVQLVYTAVMRRIALEARLYKKVPISRFLFFMRTRSWTNAAVTLLLYSILSFLALGTVIGFPIVFYGLSMVPYILAENPKIKPLEAIKLSWRMTRGNKWNMFVNSVTLLGWDVLGVITGGITNILFASHPPGELDGFERLDLGVLGEDIRYHGQSVEHYRETDHGAERQERQNTVKQ